VIQAQSWLYIVIELHDSGFIINKISSLRKIRVPIITLYSSIRPYTVLTCFLRLSGVWHRC